MWLVERRLSRTRYFGYYYLKHCANWEFNFQWILIIYKVVQNVSKLFIFNSTQQSLKKMLDTKTPTNNTMHRNFL